MTDMQTIRVAAAQIAAGAELEKNLATILQAMEHGSKQEVQLLLFPETALTGYSPEIGHNRSPQEWPSIEKSLDKIATKANELGIATVIGSDAWDGQCWYNRSFAFDEHGQLAATYDKTHLMRTDVPYYAQGNGPVLWEWQGLRLGLLICYDVRFPEGYRELLAQGVQIILQGFYAAGGATWKVPIMGAHVISRAAETGCFVVAANVGNPLQMMRSQIIDPIGLVLTQTHEDHEQIIVADLDLRRIADSEIRTDYFMRFAD